MLTFRWRVLLSVSLMLVTLLVAGAMSGASRAWAQVSAIVVAVDPDYPPFVNRNEQGELVGFDIDLFNALAADAQLQVIYMPVQFRYLLPGVATRLYDVGSSCLFITPQRQQQVNFSRPYFATGTVLIVSIANTSIQSLEDLTDEMTVSAMQDSASAAILTSRTNAIFVPTTSVPDALDQLVAGKVDAVLADEDSMLSYQQLHPDQIKRVGDLLSYFECGLTVAKSNPELLTKLNGALSDVMANGIYEELYHKWFGDRPIPQRPTPTPTPVVTDETSATTVTQAVEPLPSSTVVTNGVTVRDTRVGNYYLRLVDNAGDRPERYQILTLAENGIWFVSDNLAQTASSQPGLWQINQSDNVEATMILFLPSPSTELSPTVGTSEEGQVLQKAYQMSVDRYGSVTGHYTATTYSAVEFAQSASASPLQIETAAFSGRRVEK